MRMLTGARPPRVFQARGVTLVVTVLISIAAATIALVLVHQVALSAQSTRASGNLMAARALVEQTQTSFEAKLAADPNFYLTEVFRDERPRLCDTEEGGKVVKKAVLPDPAGRVDVPWPTACGPHWTYPGTGARSVLDTDDRSVGPSVTSGFGPAAVWDPAEHPVRMEIDPPSAVSAALTVRILAVSGGEEAGTSVTYRRPAADAVTVYSTGDLNMDKLPATTPISGTWYTAGRMLLPQGATTFSAATLMAEGGFSGPAPDGARLYAPDPAPDSGVASIRVPAPNALTLGSLRDSAAALRNMGCTAGVPLGTVTAGGATFGRQLCLTAGVAAQDTSGAAVYDTADGTAGGGAPRAYLLLPSGDASHPTVWVYTAAAAPSKAGNCAIRCDPRALAAPDYAAGSFPASKPAAKRDTAPGAPLWQPLGEFPMPVTGVIVTDADTYIGRCPGSIDPGGSCPPATFRAPVTIVAGTSARPRNIVLGASIAAAAGARVGLVATRAVVAPFFSHAEGGSLTVAASVVALGYGLDASGSALVAVPASAPAGSGGSDLKVSGSIAAPGLDLALPGWRHVTVAPRSGPALLPGFGGTWQRTSAAVLTPAQVCGASSCAGLW